MWMWERQLKEWRSGWKKGKENPSSECRGAEKEHEMEQMRQRLGFKLL